MKIKNPHQQVNKDKKKTKMRSNVIQTLIIILVIQKDKNNKTGSVLNIIFDGNNFCDKFICLKLTYSKFENLNNLIINFS